VEGSQRRGPEQSGRRQNGYDDSADVVVLSGDLFAADCDSVRAALAPALAPDDRSRSEVVIDVRAVRVLDAAVIGLLLQAWQSCQEAGRQLRVAGAQGIVRRAILATGAQRLLALADRDAGDVAARGHDHPNHRRWPRARLTGVLALVATDERHRLDDQQARTVARIHQQAVDREIGAARLALLVGLRSRLRRDPGALLDEQFLAVADRPAVLDGIVLAGALRSGADACDLRLIDSGTTALRVVRQRGLLAEFRRYFGVGGPGPAVASASTLAAATGDPVLVDDVTRSSIYHAPRAQRVLRAVGLRSVYAYPLHDDAGQLLGVLSCHYRAAGPHAAADHLVEHTVRALAQLPG